MTLRTTLHSAWNSLPIKMQAKTDTTQGNKEINKEKFMISLIDFFEQQERI
jgi:hypothetical protein